MTPLLTHSEIKQMDLAGGEAIARIPLGQPDTSTNTGVHLTLVLESCACGTKLCGAAGGVREVSFNLDARYRGPEHFRLNERELFALAHAGCS